MAAIGGGVSTPSSGTGQQPGTGTGDLHFTFHQDAPAAVWYIAHGLGKNPSVTVLDSAGSVCEGGISYPDAGTVVLTFSAAFAGVAYLN